MKYETLTIHPGKPATARALRKYAMRYTYETGTGLTCCRGLTFWSAGRAGSRENTADAREAIAWDCGPVRSKIVDIKLIPERRRF